MAPADRTILRLPRGNLFSCRRDTPGIHYYLEGMHENPIMLLLAGAFSAALLGGLLSKRVGLSPIVGYLGAGVAVSFFGAGSPETSETAGHLAEIGVVLLMFGVGVHFHLKDLIAVRKVALTGALGQSAAATAITVALAGLVGLPWTQGLILGIAVSVASTVVLARTLTERGLVDTPAGHSAVGWLVVEDIITILVLVLLPPLAGAGHGTGGLWETLAVALSKLALLVALVFLAGAKFIPWLLVRVAQLRSRELFTLTVLTIAVAVATVSSVVFGASMALGAFLAGMVVGQSKVSQQAAADALPLRDAFAVLFFVSVGMLFDWRSLVQHGALFVGLLAVIFLAKPLTAVLLVFLTRSSVKTALTVAGGLAQVGEFSFILSTEALRLNLVDPTVANLLVGAAILSISLNPWMFNLWLALEKPLNKVRWLARWIDGPRRKAAQPVNLGAAPLETGRTSALVVGYGPVGRAVVERLIQEGVSPVVIEMNVDTVLELQASGIRAFYGDAAGPDLLHQAGLDSASYILLTLPDTSLNLRILRHIREGGSEATILSRARYRRDREALEVAGADVVCVEEDEAAEALAAAFRAQRSSGIPSEDL